MADYPYFATLATKEPRKMRAQALDRHEHEEQIPLSWATELLADKNPLVVRRSYIEHEGKSWKIDEYLNPPLSWKESRKPGMKPVPDHLVVAEVDLSEQDLPVKAEERPPLTFPAFVQEKNEVTDNGLYSDINLVRLPHGAEKLYERAETLNADYVLRR